MGPPYAQGKAADRGRFFQSPRYWTQNSTFDSRYINQNQIVLIIFRSIWNQTVIRLVPNQSENRKYNLILVELTRIRRGYDSARVSQHFGIQTTRCPQRFADKDSATVTRHVYATHWDPSNATHFNMYFDADNSLSSSEYLLKCLNLQGS